MSKNGDIITILNLSRFKMCDDLTQRKTPEAFDTPEFVKQYFAKREIPLATLPPELTESLTTILTALGPKFTERTPQKMVMAEGTYPGQSFANYVYIQTYRIILPETIINVAQTILGFARDCDPSKTGCDILTFFMQKIPTTIISQQVYRDTITQCVGKAMFATACVALGRDVDMESLTDYETRFGLMVLRDFLTQKQQTEVQEQI